MKTAYCPACKTDFVATENPPYSVMHMGQGVHVHPITREVMTEVPNDDEGTNK